MTSKNYLLLVSALLMGTLPMAAQSIIGVTTTDQLFRINNASAPNAVSAPIAITGLTTGQSIAGTDFRPATGQLYALGYDPSNGNAQLYTINTTTAAATAVGAAMTLALGTGSIGFDFNPTVDRIRVTGANQKNYRLHPVTGVIVATDGDLSYAPGDINSAATPSIGASAYTNSYIGSEATVLYNYDELLNVITTQVPPNNGTQNTTGASGITINTADRSIDMDIVYDTASKTNVAYLAANIASSANDLLYTVNLATGAATVVGTIGAGMPVKDIAVVIDRSLPVVTGRIVYALTKTNGNLISFDSDKPAIIRSLLPVTGITAGQKLVGMDFRPADRQLYALGYNAATTDYQVYTINTETGAAIAVNATAGQIALGNGTNIGFDFNPVPDRIRVVSGVNGNNFRLNPNDGLIAATDTMLNYAMGDANAGTTPYVASVAYTNSYPGATATLLHGIDDSANVFLTINPPNAGKLNTIVSDFLALNPLDITSDIDFYYDSVAAANVGYLAANTGSSVHDGFYSFTTAGATSFIGGIGFGIPVIDIAVKIDFTNAPPVGIFETRREGHQLSYYPNPANDMLYFQNLPAGKSFTATLSDISGRLIHRAALTNNEISLSGIPAGMYILQVAGGGEQFAPVKLIKK